MKSKILAMMATAMLTVSASAATVHQWSGAGTAYAPNGVSLGDYQVNALVTQNASVIQSDVTVTLADGSQKQISQKITLSPTGGWSTDSSLGKGGGSCYGT